MRDLFGGVSEQAKASKHRMDDARALLAASRWRGAMYLAGYSVECALKVRLMKMFGCRNLQVLDEHLRERGGLDDDATVFTHGLVNLLALARVWDRLQADQPMARRFRIVNRWIPAWRYSADLSNRSDAEEFIEAVGRTLQWIEANI